VLGAESATERHAWLQALSLAKQTAITALQGSLRRSDISEPATVAEDIPHLPGGGGGGSGAAADAESLQLEEFGLEESAAEAFDSIALPQALLEKQERALLDLRDLCMNRPGPDWSSVGVNKGVTRYLKQGENGRGFLATPAHSSVAAFTFVVVAAVGWCGSGRQGRRDLAVQSARTLLVSLRRERPTANGRLGHARTERGRCRRAALVRSHSVQGEV
jgi:hypothetical protein